MSIYLLYSEQIPKNTFQKESKSVKSIRSGLELPSMNQGFQKQSQNNNEQKNQKKANPSIKNVIKLEENFEKSQSQKQILNTESEKLLKKVNIPFIYSEFRFPLLENMKESMQEIQSKKLNSYLELAQNMIDKEVDAKLYLKRILFRAKVLQCLIFYCILIGMAYMLGNNENEDFSSMGQYIFGISIILTIIIWVTSQVIWQVQVKHLESNLKIVLGKLNSEKLGLQFFIRNTLRKKYLSVNIDSFLFQYDFQKHLDESQFINIIKPEDYVKKEKNIQDLEVIELNEDLQEQQILKIEKDGAEEEKQKLLKTEEQERENPLEQSIEKQENKEIINDQQEIHLTINDNNNNENIINDNNNIEENKRLQSPVYSFSSLKSLGQETGINPETIKSYQFAIKKFKFREDDLQVEEELQKPRSDNLLTLKQNRSLQSTGKKKIFSQQPSQESLPKFII